MKFPKALQSKWMDFREVVSGKKTKQVVVETKEGIYLGIIKWQNHWRQYGFYPASGKDVSVCFSSGCLFDIMEVVSWMNLVKRHEDGRR